MLCEMFARMLQFLGCFFQVAGVSSLHVPFMPESLFGEMFTLDHLDFNTFGQSPCQATSLPSGIVTWINEI